LKNIFIIGFKSSGKTTLGLRISKDLKCKFIDTDRELLDRFNYKNINSLYNFLSKDNFRKEEAKLITELLKTSNREGISCRVISLGGGTLFNEYLKESLKDYGVLLFIDTPLEIIKGRLKNTKSIYDNKDIGLIYNERIKYFRDITDFTITSTNYQEIVGSITKELNTLRV